MLLLSLLVIVLLALTTTVKHAQTNLAVIGLQVVARTCPALSMDLVPFLKLNAEGAQLIISVVVLLVVAKMVSAWVLKETRTAIITWIVLGA